MKTGDIFPKHPKGLRAERPVYPFAAIVGQEEMKLGLLLNVIDPKIGGVLIMGHRGTGKSTAVRALADLLPQTERVRGCLYGCDPDNVENLCDDCSEQIARAGKLLRERTRVPVVDLPLGSTEDRVCGSINIERALTEGVKAFEPGLLARANRGFLYIDEVNLLEDHLVDLLLDTAATGRNTVERESVSVEHPARFVLVGSGNPEEGELRPQLLDRFGLHVEIKTIEDLDERLLIVERREEFERDAAAFRSAWQAEQQKLRRRLMRARKIVSEVKLERALLRQIGELCLRLRVDGHRGELTVARSARALAAFEGRNDATASDVKRVAVMALRHRLRRDALDQTPGGARIDQALEKLFPAGADAERTDNKNDGGDFEPDDFHGGGRNGKQGSNGHDPRASEEEQSALPEPGTDIYEQTLELPHANEAGKTRAASHSARRQPGQSKTSYNHLRGRYTRATERPPLPGSRIALDATLRAMLVDAGEKKEVGASGSSFSGVPSHSRDSLRYKLFRRKTGTLFIFAVDTSGSMALNRIRQAKGALVHLLERSYIRRDHVALVSFRGPVAEILLSPSQSVTRARALLDELPVGGSTPLASALAAALGLAERASCGGERKIILFLFTDGRANVPVNSRGPVDKNARRVFIKQELRQLGAALKSARVSTVVVDTQNRFTSNSEGRELAGMLEGNYIFLPGKGDAEEFERFNHRYIDSMSL
jgi:magnesium chelatase subunit D